MHESVVGKTIIFPDKFLYYGTAASGAVLYDEYRDHAAVWWSGGGGGDRASGVIKWTCSSLRRIGQMGNVKEMKLS